jgi:hypothetical protein
MPYVYFDAYELTHCPWCGCNMLCSVVEMMCVDCSLRFTEHLHPSSLWREPKATLSLLTTRDDDFGDSMYERSEACICHGEQTHLTKVVAAIGTDCTNDVNSRGISIMYDIFVNTLKYSHGPFQIEEDLWAEFVRSDSLSNCWVSVAERSTLVQLSLPEFQYLSRYFTLEAPLGFLIINCTTQASFHICNLGIIQYCELRSACHYLRNYPHQTIGFVITESAKHACNEVSILQCGRSLHTFCDRYLCCIAHILLDRMMKTIIGSYSQVVFRYGSI